jgi:hypothetical protein
MKRHRRRVVALTATGILVAATLIGGGWWLGSEARSVRRRPAPQPRPWPPRPPQPQARRWQPFAHQPPSRRRRAPCRRHPCLPGPGGGFRPRHWQGVCTSTPACGPAASCWCLVWSSTIRPQAAAPVQPTTRSHARGASSHRLPFQCRTAKAATTPCGRAPRCWDGAWGLMPPTTRRPTAGGACRQRRRAASTIPGCGPAASCWCGVAVRSGETAG